MQTDSSKIRNRITVSIFQDDNDLAMGLIIASIDKPKCLLAKNIYSR